MANPGKKGAKKSSKSTASKKPEASKDVEEEYELLPHKDIVELREELKKLKSLPPEAGAHAEASYEELSKKMDKLVEVFEEAEKTIKVEEGAATFKEKMAPVVEKMNTILKQNSEIAEGIVALADIMNEVKDKLEVGVIYKSNEAEKVKTEPIHRPAPPGAAPKPPGGESGLPPPPGMAPPPGPVPTAAPPGGPMPRFGAPPPMPGAAPGTAPPRPAPTPGPMPPPPGAPARKKGLFKK